MSNFKMKHKGVPALMKTLTAGQQGMIKSMRESGKTAQANAIEKGIKDAPAKKITDKNRKELGRGGKDVVISEKESTVRRRDNKNTGARDFEQVTQTVEKGSRAQKGTTMSDRQGGGRMAKKTYQRVKGQKGKYTMVGSDIAGTKTKGGRTQYRKLADGSKVVVEASLKERGEAPKARGVQTAKIKKTDISKDLKEKAPRRKVKTASAITPVKKKGVKGLKKAALKKYGSKPIKKYGCKK